MLRCQGFGVPHRWPPRGVGELRALLSIIAVARVTRHRVGTSRHLLRSLGVVGALWCGHSIGQLAVLGRMHATSQTYAFAALHAAEAMPVEYTSKQIAMFRLGWLRAPRPPPSPEYSFQVTIDRGRFPGHVWESYDNLGRLGLDPWPWAATLFILLPGLAVCALALRRCPLAFAGRPSAGADQSSRGEIRAAWRAECTRSAVSTPAAHAFAFAAGLSVAVLAETISLVYPYMMYVLRPHSLATYQLEPIMALLAWPDLILLLGALVLALMGPPLFHARRAIHRSPVFSRWCGRCGYACVPGQPDSGAVCSECGDSPASASSASRTVNWNRTAFALFVLAVVVFYGVPHFLVAVWEFRYQGQ